MQPSGDKLPIKTRPQETPPVTDVLIAQLNPETGEILADANGEKLCFLLPAEVINSLAQLAANLDASRPQKEQQQFQDWFHMVQQNLMDGLAKMAMDRFPPAPVQEAKVLTVAAEKAQEDALVAVTSKVVRSPVIALKPKIEPTPVVIIKEA